MTVPKLSFVVGSAQVTVVFGVPKGTVTLMSSGKLVTKGSVLSAVGKELSVLIYYSIHLY